MNGEPGGGAGSSPTELSTSTTPANGMLPNWRIACRVSSAASDQPTTTTGAIEAANACRSRARVRMS